MTTPCVAANRSVYGVGILSDGILTSITYRSRHVAARDISSLALTYFNASGTNDTGLNVVNYKAGIEYNGAVTAVNFGGVRTVAVAASAKVVSDDVSVFIPKGGVFYVRTYVSVSAGNKWVATGQIDRTNWGESILNSTDAVDQVGILAQGPDGSYMLSPIAITSPATDVPGVIIYGDSIANGSGDSTTFNRGYLMRALNRGLLTAGIPFSNVAFPGETIQGFVNGANGILRKALPSAITYRDAIVAYGVNDIVAGRTAAQVEADLLTLYNTLAAQGCRVWGVTLFPRTVSSDGWTTTVNQTPTVGFQAGSHREVVNAWLRTIPAPLTGIIDVADVVETARNSALWKVSPVWTADGTHPNAQADVVIAGVVPVSLLGIASLTAQVVG